MHPNEKLARQEMELIMAGKMDEVAKLYADDFVFHYPGKNPLAGTYTSFDEFAEKAEKLFAGGGLTRVLHDALGTDDHAIQLIEVTGEGKGRSHSWHAVVIGHVRDGQFTEMWLTSTTNTRSTSS